MPPFYWQVLFWLSWLGNERHYAVWQHHNSTFHMRQLHITKIWIILHNTQVYKLYSAHVIMLYRIANDLCICDYINAYMTSCVVHWQITWFCEHKNEQKWRKLQSADINHFDGKGTFLTSLHCYCNVMSITQDRLWALPFLAWG